MLGRRPANPECPLIAQGCPLVRSGRSAAGPPAGNHALAIPRAKCGFSAFSRGRGCLAHRMPPSCPMTCPSMRPRGCVLQGRTNAYQRGSQRVLTGAGSIGFHGMELGGTAACASPRQGTAILFKKDLSGGLLKGIVTSDL